MSAVAASIPMAECPGCGHNVLSNFMPLQTLCDDCMWVMRPIGPPVPDPQGELRGRGAHSAARTQSRSIIGYFITHGAHAQINPSSSRASSRAARRTRAQVGYLSVRCTAAAASATSKDATSLRARVARLSARRTVEGGGARRPIGPSRPLQVARHSAQLMAVAAAVSTRAATAQHGPAGHPSARLTAVADAVSTRAARRARAPAARTSARHTAAAAGAPLMAAARVPPQVASPSASPMVVGGAVPSTSVRRGACLSFARPVCCCRCCHCHRCRCCCCRCCAGSPRLPCLARSCVLRVQRHVGPQVLHHARPERQ